MSPLHRFDPGMRQRDERIQRNARNRYGLYLNRDFFCGRIHVVNPSSRFDIDPDPGSMSESCKNVRRPCSSCCYNGIARFQTAQQELEGTDFVSSTHSGIEILALDPAVTIAWYSLDRGGKSAQLHPRDLRKRREPAEQGNPGVGSA
jgi:hypothetical protein